MARGVKCSLRKLEDPGSWKRKLVEDPEYPGERLNVIAYNSSSSTEGVESGSDRRTLGTH